jgi:rfaE bifunctional protein kinase chain/domain
LTTLTKSRAEEILDSMAGLRLLVVGDLILDRYISGSVERVSPEAPVPVVHVEETASAPGGAGNVAANAVALGAECHLVGCLGDDGGGLDLERELVRLGVQTDGVIRVSDRPTTTKTRILARRQQVVRFDQENALPVPPEVAEGVLSMVQVLLPECDAVILEDYNKGVLVPEIIRGTLKAAAVHGIPSVVDPKSRNFFEFHGCTVFKPNRPELEAALGQPCRPDDPEWMAATRERLDCRHLLLTLGEAGMSLETPESELIRVPSRARDVYDVSGAGDTVTAVVAAALAAGAEVTEAAILANHAAAVEVGKVGVATVSPAEILEQLSTG